MGTFYIRQPELTYIHVPRTGLAMKAIIHEWLKPNFDLDDKTDWMINHPNLQMVKERIPTGKTISVVRNPWARVWSFYRKISEEGYWLDWNGMNLMDLKPFDKWLEDYADPSIPFEFPRWFNRFTNAVDFLSYEDGTGTHVVDFVLKAETIDLEFKVIQQYLGCFKPIPNISKYQNHTEYKKYYTSQGSKIISKIFERDIDTFKYVF
jgi:hypothetical protein